MSGKLHTQALRMLQYMLDHPGARTKEEIRVAAKLTSDFNHLVAYVRYQAGQEVLVTKYDKSQKAYVYTLAVTKDEALDYVGKRREQVRNETANLVSLIDRTSAKWGTDPVLEMARLSLKHAVETLDMGSSSTAA